MFTDYPLKFDYIQMKVEFEMNQKSVKLTHTYYDDYKSGYVVRYFHEITHDVTSIKQSA